MTSLQIGLIVAGVVLVAGVLLYNWLQERRVRRRIDAAFAPRAAGADVLLDVTRGAAARGPRVEPTLGDEAPARPRTLPERARARARRRRCDALRAAGGRHPPDEQRGHGRVTGGPACSRDLRRFRSRPTRCRGRARRQSAGSRHRKHRDAATGAAGDRGGAGGRAACAARQAAALVRSPDADEPWQRLGSDTRGEFAEIAGCLLLADRTGAASAPLLDAFVRLAGEVAASLPAAILAPSAGAEAERAEALDRICADLDVQIGLTLLKTGPTTIPGTRLRGVAEAAGFRLAAGGRFEWVQEETGAVLYALQNYRSEPFTADTLRLMATPGAVLLLDVPRVADPARVFDQMKLVAKRMAQTLDAALVDDNRRPLDDAALAAIRQQVQATATAMKDVRIEPGSPRALALFGG